MLDGLIERINYEKKINWLISIHHLVTKKNQKPLMISADQFQMLQCLLMFREHREHLKK